MHAFKDKYLKQIILFKNRFHMPKGLHKSSEEILLLSFDCKRIKIALTYSLNGAISWTSSV